MSKDLDVEAALRASLAARAQHAPSGGFLAERVIAQAESTTATEPRRARQWRTWTLPLVAAGSVAAVVAAAVGISHIHPSADRPGPANPITSVTSPAVHTPTPPPSPTTHPTTPTTTATNSGGANVSSVGVHRFRVVDLTFIGSGQGWAIGTADCKSGGAKSCAAMVHTTDAGVSWHSMTQPGGANIGPIGCAAPCIQHIRFASSTTGYAYGSAALYMTTDAGKSWVKQPGGADALETLGGNVIRIVHAGQGCPPGCTYSVQTAPIASSKWHDVALPAATGGMSDGVDFARNSQAAYVLVKGHTAGGAQGATSTLFVSTDQGASWHSRGEPCPQSGSGEVDSTELTSGADGSVTVLCTPRGAETGEFTSTAASGQTGFTPGKRSALDAAGASAVTAIGTASGSVIVVADASGAFRSTDGGVSFRRLTGSANSVPAGATWIGFESTTVGRAVSSDGSTIWTTHDAGRTWSPFTFD